MYIFLIVKTGSSLIHPHGFQLFVLLPWLIEINSFVCSNKINRLCVKPSSFRIVIVAKGS